MELNQDLIEEGKALVVKAEQAERMTCENRLELGRWALKLAPKKPLGTNQYSEGSSTDEASLIAAYADAIDLKPITLCNYRDVAAAWGNEDSMGLSWGVLRRLAYRDDRHELITAIFEKYGKVTEPTFDKYTAWLREENTRRQALLQQQVREAEVLESMEEEEEWVENDTDYVCPPVTTTTTTTTTRHGYSNPIRKLFSAVEHVKAAHALFQEESVPSVDLTEENFEEVLGACDTIITEIMAYREALVAKRVKAGLQ